MPADVLLNPLRVQASRLSEGLTLDDDGNVADAAGRSRWRVGWTMPDAAPGKLCSPAGHAC